MAQVNTGLVNQLTNLLGAVKPHNKHIKALIKYSRLTSSPLFNILHVLSIIVCIGLAVDFFFESNYVGNALGTDAYLYIFVPSFIILLWTAFQKHSMTRLYEVEAQQGWYCTLVNSNPQLSDAYFVASNLKKMIRVLRSGKASDFRSAAAAANIKDRGREVDIEKLNKHIEKAEERVLKKAQRAQDAEETAEGIFIIFSLLWKLIKLPFTIMDGIWNIFFDSPEEIIERSRAESERFRVVEQVKRDLERDGWRKY